MIVVMTMWLPRFACSQPGMKAQKAPKAMAQADRQRNHNERRPVPQVEPDQPGAEPTQVGLPLAADVEEAAVEGDGNGEPGEDEIGCVVKGVADRLR